MPILRATESRILPGRRQQWLDVTRDLKKIVDKHGANLRALELAFGGYPGTVIISSLHESWEAVAARNEAISADKEFQALMASVPKLPGFPFAEPVEVRLATDITDEVGGGSAPLENAQVIQLMTMRVRPGKRAKQIDFIRQMREARKGAGEPVGNLMQIAAGDASTMSVVRGYASLAEWAKDRAAGESKAAADVAKRAQADSQYPFADLVAIRVFRNITSQL
jgi:hypothetical protein